MDRKKIVIPIIILTVIIIAFIIFLGISHEYRKLSVSEEKWNLLIASRTENSKLVIDEIGFNDYGLIIDNKTDTIFYSLVNSSSKKYNPKVDFTSNRKEAQIAILSDEITDEKVQSGHQFKIMIYTEKEYHIYHLVCTDFPILNLSYRQDVGDKHKNIPIKMYLFNNLSNSTNRVTISDGRLKVGQDGYHVSLSMITPGNNIRDNKISLFNMKPESEYTLRSENLYEQSKTDGNSHKVALFINNQYQGIFLLEAGKNMPERKNNI